MTKLEELREQEAAAQKVYDEANAAKRAAEKRVRAEHAAALEAALAAVNAEHDPVSRAAWLVLHPITTAAQAEAVREAEAGENLPHPLGTVFARWLGAGWRSGADGFSGDYTHFLPMKERAVLEVFKPGDTIRPENHNAYGEGDPKPGDLVLRDLKANKKRGVSCRKFRPEDRMWLPEGVQHPMAKP